MEFFLAIIGILTIITIKTLMGNKNKRIINKIPGPKAYPIVGNFFSLARQTWELLPDAIKKFDEHGPIMRLWFGSIPFVVTKKPEYVEVILSSTRETKKSFLYSFMKPWLGEGLLTSHGPRWHQHRKLITPTFHFNILESFISVFESNSAILVGKLEEHAKSGEVFDLYPYITMCALDIICESAMGICLNAQEKKEHPYVVALAKISKLIMERSQHFYLFSDITYSLTAASREFKQCLKTLHNFTECVIKERKALRQASSNQEDNQEENEFGRKKKKAFLDLLLDSAGNMTDQDLREEVDTFMFGGHDTTTSNVSWTIYLLGRHPEIQDQVAEEVRSVCPDEETLSIAKLNDMKLLDRVVKESLRMYPSAPFISRQLQNDIKLGDYLIPAETVVEVSIAVLHRDASIYPDPMKFDPDRFLPENIKKRHPYAYVPFSAGPRNCIGQKYAMLEEKAMIANLVRKFKITSVEKPEDVIEVSEVVLRPLNGIKIKVNKRD